MVALVGQLRVRNSELAFQLRSPDLVEPAVRFGVDLDDVGEVLEREGVEKFETSWNDLLESVNAKLEAAK